MNDHIHPEFIRLIKILNETVIKIDDAEKLIARVQDTLQGFKNLRDEVLTKINKQFPESSRN